MGTSVKNFEQTLLCIALSYLQMKVNGTTLEIIHRFI